MIDVATRLALFMLIIFGLIIVSWLCIFQLGAIYGIIATSVLMIIVGGTFLARDT